MTAMTAGLRVLRTPGRRWLVALTLLLGLVTALAVAAATPPPQRTFAAVAGPALMVMSVLVPFLGVLLVTELRRPARPAIILATVGAAVGPALLIAGSGVAACAAVTAILPSASADRWANAGVVAIGGLLVEAVATLVGTGLGLLLPRAVPACLATIVLPLGLLRLLGAVPDLRPAQAWLTPFPSAQHLLSGEMSGTTWAQWLVVLAIWGVGLNVIGAAAASRGGPRPHAGAGAAGPLR